MSAVTVIVLLVLGLAWLAFFERYLKPENVRRRALRRNRADLRRALGRR